MSDRQYLAFMSYSHRDKKWADWLHRALETYRLPKHLVGRATPVGPAPSRLRPIFRDRDELAASADLGERIEHALTNAAALVVLCSPSAAKSKWTNEEIATFKRIHPDRPILAAILEGEPYASTMAGREEEECFPEALRFELDPDGTLSDRRAEPIAADFRKQGDGKRLGKLKLVAGLLGTGLDELVQRDNARRTRRLAFAAAASAVGMVGTSALALYAFDQRNEAREQRAEADGLIEYMLTDLRGKLDKVGRLDTLEGVGNEALGYYARQDLDDLDDDALGRRSRALLLVGELADLRGDSETAMRSFEQAAASTEALLLRDPENWQRVFDHAQSVFWVGYAHDERGQNDRALPKFVEYKELSEKLTKLRPEDPTSHFELASSWINLGFMYRRTRDFDEAIEAFTRARESFAAIKPATDESRMAVVDAQSHLASSLFGAGRDQDHVSARLTQLKMLSDLGQDDQNLRLQELEAYTRLNLGIAHFSLKKYDAAREAIADARTLFSQMAQFEPSNTGWAEQVANSTVDLALVNFADAGRLQDSTDLSRAVGSLDRLWALKANDASIATAYIRALAVSHLAGVSDQSERLEAALSKISETQMSIDGDERPYAFGLVALIIAACPADAKEPERRKARVRELLSQGNAISSIDRALLRYTQTGNPATKNPRTDDNENISGTHVFLAKSLDKREKCNGVLFN